MLTISIIPKFIHLFCDNTKGTKERVNETIFSLFFTNYFILNVS